MTNALWWPRQWRTTIIFGETVKNDYILNDAEYRIWFFLCYSSTIVGSAMPSMVISPLPEAWSHHHPHEAVFNHKVFGLVMRQNKYMNKARQDTEIRVLKTGGCFSLNACCLSSNNLNTVWVMRTLSISIYFDIMLAFIASMIGEWILLAGHMLSSPLP